MKIGYAEVDITPELGIPCALGLDNECEEIFDPISVIAIAIEHGDERVMLTAADVLGLTRPETLKLRGMVGEKTGVPAERVVIHCTHSHESPCLRVEYGEYLRERGLRAYDPEYWERVQNAWVTAAETAVADLKPARVAWGMAKVDRVASNRRVVEPDGQIRMRGSRAAADDADYPEGSIDPYVRVLRFDRAEAEPVALVSYCCHPSVAGGDEGPYITADICGVVRRVLGETNACSTLYMTGTCGNINPGRYAGLKGRKQDVLALGYRLAVAAEDAYESAETVDAGQVSWAYRPVALQVREGIESAAELEAEVERLIAEHKELHARGEKAPGGAVRRPLARLMMRRVAEQGAIPTEVCALRLGEKGVVFYPGECFVEMAYCLYAEHGAQNIMAVENCDYTPSYILPPAAYAGGYEADVCRVAPSAFGMLVGAALEALEATGLEK